MYVQIDALHFFNGALPVKLAPSVICNLYTGDRVVKITMTRDDYEALKRDRFFIRPADEKDSGGAINTTREYLPRPDAIPEEPTTGEFADGLE